MLVISMTKVSGWVEARIQVSRLLHCGYFYHTKPQTFHPSPGCSPLLWRVLGKKKPLAVTLRMLWFDLTLVYQVTNRIHCSQDYIWKLSGILHWTELKICLSKTELSSSPMVIYVLLDFLICSCFYEPWFLYWQDED